MIHRVASLKTVEQFKKYLARNGIQLSSDDSLLTGAEAPLAQPYHLKDGFVIGNRFCVQPMEGWDGTADGAPTELTRRRWVHFGQSGAKLIWGGEAVAVQPAGRANPNQVLICPATLSALAELRKALLAAHTERYGDTRELLVGLQLTHSGRFSRPVDKIRLAPKILYHHPYLDARYGIAPDDPVLTDPEIGDIIADFVSAAGLAQQAGFDFVDIKHCHGYLGHEFLSAYSRPGPYGGSFENRTRFLREVVVGIRSQSPGLRIGVRLSAFDTPPFVPDHQTQIGKPVTCAGYPWGFGLDECKPLEYNLEETTRFLELFQTLGIELVNITAGSPYYNPHIQRPAYFPPSDGYQPPEDPLFGVARQIEATAELKQRFPGLLMVGSAYSYLQEWLPYVAQHNVRHGKVDFIGLGRMILSYPEFPADVLAGRQLDRRRICRTFSDCTTAPRQGLVSGCYPLDPFYKARPEAEMLKAGKKA